MWKILKLWALDGFKSLNNFETVYQRTGEYVCLIGANGAGKNHLMDVINRQKLSAIPVGFSSGKNHNLLTKTKQKLAQLGKSVRKIPKTKPVLKSKPCFDIWKTVHWKPTASINRPCSSRLTPTQSTALIESIKTVRLAKLVLCWRGLCSQWSKAMLEIGMLLAADPRLFINRWTRKRAWQPKKPSARADLLTSLAGKRTGNCGSEHDYGICAAYCAHRDRFCIRALCWPKHHGSNQSNKRCDWSYLVKEAQEKVREKNMISLSMVDHFIGERRFFGAWIRNRNGSISAASWVP